MANCSDLFKVYDSTITLGETKVKSLKVSRGRIRKRIRKYFAENHPKEIQPKFSSQGSVIHGSATEPLPKEVEKAGKKYTFLEYDVDDGVHFKGDITDRKSVQIYHNRVLAAVTGHTQTFDPEDKTTCVRVLFSDGHHIDLPIYFKEKVEAPTLAHRTKGWITSDPLAFTEWLEERTSKSPQILRLIRYMKGWKIYREDCRSDKYFPSGFILSILVCNHFIPNHQDDVSFKETMSNMHTALSAYGGFKCYRPTAPSDEDLLASYAHKEYFLDQLKGIVDGGVQALKTDNQKVACEKWQSFFGPRFSCATAKDESQSKSTSAAFASTASKSRPWAG